MCDSMHDVKTILGLKSSLNYERCPGNRNLQFRGHHLYFRRFLEICSILGITHTS